MEIVPSCCGHEMTLIRSGRRAGFAIWVWRCPACERFETTNRRYDGKSFWVGAMGERIHEEAARLIAEAYGSGFTG